MNTRSRLSVTQMSVTQTGLLPTRHQLEKFLQSRGTSPKNLGQMSTWEQIQLTHEYQQSLVSDRRVK